MSYVLHLLPSQPRNIVGQALDQRALGLARKHAAASEANASTVVGVRTVAFVWRAESFPPVKVTPFGRTSRRAHFSATRANRDEDPGGLDSLDDLLQSLHRAVFIHGGRRLGSALQARAEGRRGLSKVGVLAGEKGLSTGAGASAVPRSSSRMADGEVLWVGTPDIISGLWF